MSLSEFRYNKKRKHYAYIFKENKSRLKCILLSSKPYRKDHMTLKKNIKLHAHPNPNSDKQVYMVPIVYNDDVGSFDSKVLNWNFHPNDKRKIKRIKKHKRI